MIKYLSLRIVFFLIISGVQGYVRSAIIVLTNGSSSYGNGSITDAHFRLPIHITKFNGQINKGALVELKGRLKANDQKAIHLQVPDEEHITLINAECATWDFMKGGFHPLLATQKTKSNSITNDATAQENRRKSNFNEEQQPRKVNRIIFF